MPLNHPIIVVDDSENKKKINIKRHLNTIHLQTPFDVGVSEGRNIGLKFVNTEFVVFCDDDFIFYEETNLDHFLESMAKGFDIIGGAVEGKPMEGSMKFQDTSLYLKKESKGDIQGIPRYDFVSNFFIARTETIKKFPWDLRLKLGERIDFFFKIKNRIIAGYDERVKIKHQEENNNEFNVFRSRETHFLAQMVKKLRLKKFVDLEGNQFVDITKTGQHRKTIKEGVEVQPNIFFTAAQVST